jgi:lysozyme
VDIEKLKAELRRDEGLRYKVYRCSAGHRTIGYGHMVDNNPSISTCTLEDAEIWLSADIKSAILIADIFLWPENLHNFSESQQRALVNMSYNIGLRICQFRRLRQALAEGDWSWAAREILDSKYARQVGDRAKRVAKLMENGYAGS